MERGYTPNIPVVGFIEHTRGRLYYAVLYLIKEENVLISPTAVVVSYINDKYK